MDKLKGKTILIGKEPGQGRLLVAIQGNDKTATIGMPGSVPACVSRCKPFEGVAHAKLTVDQSGNMVLTNMKSQNVTFVNGTEIASKRVSLANSVELGKDHFSINLPVVIETAKKIAAVSTMSHGAPQPQGTPMPGQNAPRPAQTPQGQSAQNKRYDISHLERVWNDYHDKGIEIQQRQRQQGLLQSLPMFFTMGGSAITFALSFVLGEEYKQSIHIFSGVLVVIGVCLLFFSFMKRKNDNSLEEREKMLEDFQDHYICPNPDCRKFLGTYSYRLMKRQFSMRCPHCKCEFVERKR